MAYLELSAFLADDALQLRGVPTSRHPDGKTYIVKSPSAKFALQLQRMMQLWGQRDRDAPPSEDDVAELVELTTGEDGKLIDFRERLLGPVLTELVEDGISAERLHMVTQLVLIHYGSGQQAAQMMVEQAVGEAKARPNRAARRKTGGSRSRRASTATTGSDPVATSPTSGSSTSPAAPAAEAEAV